MYLCKRFLHSLRKIHKWDLPVLSWPRSPWLHWIKPFSPLHYLPSPPISMQSRISHGYPTHTFCLQYTNFFSTLSRHADREHFRPVSCSSLAAHLRYHLPNRYCLLPLLSFNSEAYFAPSLLPSIFSYLVER